MMMSEETVRHMMPKKEAIITIGLNRDEYHDGGLCKFDRYFSGEMEHSIRRTSHRRRRSLQSSSSKFQFHFWINILTFVIFLHSVSCLEEIVCGGFDMRNSPAHFLTNHGEESIRRFNVCTVIEGDVRLILMTDENLTVQDFEPVRFPHVKEITGSLMVFQLTSLKTLEYLFPELRVIRGNTLIHNYALVLFQNSKLVEVGLPKLTEISRGGVRIVENAELCYANTINWTEIVRDRYTPPFIQNNKNANSCDLRCSSSMVEQCAHRKDGNSTVTACWNHDKCQPTCPAKCKVHDLACNYSIDGTCCHPECIGGCTGPASTDCYACRNVHFKGDCIDKCPKNYYKVFNRRCITKSECYSRKPVPDESNDEVFYKALDVTGTCEMKCPSGYEENSTNKLVCIKCPEKIGCIKKCGTATIHSLSDAENFKGCNIMNGHLDITMHSGLSTNVVEKLEEYLSSLREVKDYVKISLTPSLVSLNMLKNLRVIKGETLWNNKYAMSVFENNNLAQLWDFNDAEDGHKLRIEKGLLQFHNNPQLCYQTIDELAVAVNLMKNITEHDVSRSSNGNKAVCEELEIFLKCVYISADTAVLNWEEFNTTMMDHRMFLGYQLYYKSVESENVNIFENRDACSDSWNMMFTNTEERGALVTKLKPYTLYAFYIRTLMVNSPGAKGGISKLLFNQTKFDPPSQVILINIESISHESIYLEWAPPLLPNGEVTHYMIQYVAKPDTLPKERNYCNEPIHYKSAIAGKHDGPVGDDEPEDHRFGSSTRKWPFHVGPSGGALSPSTDADTCSKYKCCECGNVQNNGSVKLPTDEKVMEEAAFENTIHNIIFVSNKNTNTKKVEGLTGDHLLSAYTRKKREVRQKREIDFELLDDGVPNVKPRTNDSAYDELDPNSTTTESSGIELSTPVPITKNIIGLNYTLPFLKHFTSYEIKIWACQNDTIKDRENFCSRSEIIRLKRTLPIVSKDAINDTSIKVLNYTVQNNHNDQRFIKWDAPEDPNGVIVGYEVEYSRDLAANRDSSSGETTKTGKECITVGQYQLRKGYLAVDLRPGNYSFRVRALSLAQKGPWTKEIYFSIPEPYKLSDTVVILVAIGCSIIAICIGVFLVICIYRRQFKKKLPEYFMSVFSANPEYISQLEVYKPDHWELKRDDIDLVREIGRGTFGTVYEGRGKNIVSVCGARFGECAIKTVGEKATIYDRWHFLIEASVMKQFNTAYIVKLFGVVSEGQPALVVMELMCRGNLKEYLVSRRPDSDENIQGLSPPTLKEVLQMAGEIADGMAYLEAMKFCHRDLAARNCMVAADGTCKIGDFGMARDVYIKDYYRPQGRRLMPVRWMAPEALKDATFTSKSDVWSYGVVLWEVATLASQPYPGLSTEDVFSFVVDSRRIMEMPVGCPQRLYDIMKTCWKYDAKDRTSFADLVAHLLPDLSVSFTNSSFYCTQRGKEQTHRSANANLASTRLSPTVINSVLTQDEPVILNNMDCLDANSPLNLDSDDNNQTPVTDNPLTDSEAELPDPVCSNNRRTGLPKSFSSPNWNDANNRLSPVEMPLTPPTHKSYDLHGTSNGVLLNNQITTA